MRRILIVLAAAALAACTTAGDPPLAGHPLVLEAQRQVPYKLVLPRYLPAGYELANVEVSLPPVGDAIETELSFTNPSGGGLMVYELPGSGVLGDESVPVRIGSLEGRYVERVRPDGTLRVLFFHTDGGVQVSMLTLHPSYDELLAVAESMVR